MTLQAVRGATTVAVEWATSEPGFGPDGLVPVRSVMGLVTRGHRGFISRYDDGYKGIGLSDGPSAGPFSCSHYATAQRLDNGVVSTVQVIYDPKEPASGYKMANGAKADKVRERVRPYFYTSNNGDYKTLVRMSPGYADWHHNYERSTSELRKLDVKMSDQRRLAGLINAAAGAEPTARFISFPELYTVLPTGRQIDDGERTRIHTTIDELFAGDDGIEAARIATSLIELRVPFTSALVDVQRVSASELENGFQSVPDVADQFRFIKRRMAAFQALRKCSTVVFFVFARVAAVAKDADSLNEFSSEDDFDIYALRSYKNKGFDRPFIVVVPGEAISNESVNALQSSMSGYSKNAERLYFDDRSGTNIGLKLERGAKIYYRGTQISSCVDSVLDELLYAAMHRTENRRDPLWQWFRSAAFYTLAPTNNLRNLRIYDDPTDFKHPDLEAREFRCAPMLNVSQVLDFEDLDAEAARDTLRSQVGRVSFIDHNFHDQPKAALHATPLIEVCISMPVGRGAVVPA